MITEFSSTNVTKCLFIAGVCVRIVKRECIILPGICGLRRRMNGIMVVCISAMEAQAEEWERDHERLQEEVTLDLDLVSAFEIRTCSFKL